MTREEQQKLVDEVAPGYEVCTKEEAKDTDGKFTALYRDDVLCWDFDTGLEGNLRGYQYIWCRRRNCEPRIAPESAQEPSQAERLEVLERRLNHAVRRLGIDFHVGDWGRHVNERIDRLEKRIEEVAGGVRDLEDRVSDAEEREEEPPKPPEGYEFCSWEEAERDVHSGGRRALYRGHFGEWRSDLWAKRDLLLDCVVAEGRLLWLRKVAKPEPRRWGPWEEVATWEEASSGIVSNDADQRAVLVEVSESLWRVMGHKREWGLARFDHYVRHVGESK
jgi:hypothetical protein